MLVRPLAFAFVFAFALAGCTAQGAGTSNFTLTPSQIGWYVGDEAKFVLAISSSIMHSSPSFVVDRQFAIEEIQYAEKGLTFGHDFTTQDPNAVSLRLERNGTQAEKFTLDEAHPRIDVVLKVPGELRDSEYTLELKLFKVGTVKSDKFRVDVR
jgi:hypothetical protein